MPRDGELVLESTANGADGCFFEEWRHAELSGMVRHFFPWWWEPEYEAGAVAEGALTEEEQRLRAEHGLTLEQIGFRRQAAGAVSRAGGAGICRGCGDVFSGQRELRV